MTWLARVTVLALGAATLTVPLGVMTGAEAARVQPRTTAQTTTLAVINTISVGDTPLAVAINNVDDTVYVANANSNTVSVINGRNTDDSSAIPVGLFPQGVAVNQLDDTVYVVNADDSTASIINGRSTDDSRTITVGWYPIGVAVNDFDDTVYIANNLSNSLSVINGRLTDDSDAISVGNAPVAVAVDQGDDTVYVANSNTNNVWAINGRDTNDSSPIAVGSYPVSVAVNQVDDTVYIVNAFSDTLSVINGGTRTLVGTIAVGQAPRGVAVDQDDDTVFVANGNSRSVSVINGRTNTVEDTISVGSVPYAVAVDDTGTNAGLVYVTNSYGRSVSVIGRVTPSLSAASGSAGAALTLTVDAPQVTYDVDDSTVTSVTFGTTVLTGSDLTSGAGDTWEFSVPAGSGTVPVTVTFNGGLTASAGNFTYASTPTPTPVPPAPRFPPGPPTGVTGVAGDDTALVSWTPPTNSGAGPITSYYVFSTPRTGSCTATPPATSCVMTGLTNGTTYTFQVQAINIDGASSPSTPSNEVTPGTEPPPPPPTPTITITGAREDKRVKVTGTATDLTGQTLRPWIRFPGQTAFFQGLANITPKEDGTFTWQRRTGKKTTVYIAHEDTRSNTVTIPARTIPAIVITGSRDDKRIKVTGTATNLTGQTLRPWIRFPGQTAFFQGLANITPKDDGTFTWQRKTGKKTTVYVASEAKRSNRVTIPAR